MYQLCILSFHFDVSFHASLLICAGSNIFLMSTSLRSVLFKAIYFNLNARMVGAIIAHSYVTKYRSAQGTFMPSLDLLSYSAQSGSISGSMCLLFLSSHGNFTSCGRIFVKDQSLERSQVSIEILPGENTNEFSGRDVWPRPKKNINLCGKSREIPCFFPCSSDLRSFPCFRIPC